MHTQYLLGVTLGIFAGIVYQMGQLINKYVVNKLRKDSRKKGFFLRLLKNPLWFLGWVFGLGGGMALYMIAQNMIGPALAPGLLASGLIFLVLGSMWLNHESLSISEIIGIVLMIIGILFMGLSELVIDQEQVMITLSNQQALVRIGLFTFIFLSLGFTFHKLAPRTNNHQGLMIALAGGLLTCLRNFWFNPFLALIDPVLDGHGTPAQLIIFVFAFLILLIIGTVITWQNNLAFKYAQASNVVPVGQVPIQIAPILIYFVVFNLAPPESNSVIFIIAGTILTIGAGFLLGRRKEVPYGMEVPFVKEIPYDKEGIYD
jgi:LPXTG-motif cell wall-anchored protein